MAVFCNAQTVIDRAVAACCKQTRRCAQFCGGDACHGFGGLRAMAILGYEFGIFLEFFPITAGLDEVLVHQAFGHNRMGNRGDGCHVGTWTQLQVMRRRNMR